MSDRLRVVFWNVKAPELSLRGAHKWLSRRTPLRQSIGAEKADVVALAETGSGLYLTWWKHAMAKYGLTWAKGGRYWQNFFNSKRAVFITGGTRNQPKSDRLKNDDKPMTWEIFEFMGHRWVAGNVHPENNGGNTTSATNLRIRQVMNAVRWLYEIADAHDIPHWRIMLTTDCNEPTGALVRHVHRHTTLRDSFTLAEHTEGKGNVSNNKWRLHPVAGKRIDIVFLHMSVIVLKALNVWNGRLADHNKQRIDIKLTASGQPARRTITK